MGRERLDREVTLEIAGVICQLAKVMQKLNGGERHLGTETETEEADEPKNSGTPDAEPSRSVTTSARSKWSAATWGYLIVGERAHAVIGLGRTILENLPRWS